MMRSSTRGQPAVPSVSTKIDLCPIERGLEQHDTVSTPGPTQKSIPSSTTKVTKKMPKAGGSKPEKVTKDRLEAWMKVSVIESDSTANPGVFEFVGDPTSGRVSCVGHSDRGRAIGVQPSPLSLYGPTVVHDSLSKEGSSKKEDKWLLKANNTWRVLGGDDSVDSEQQQSAKVGVWGVFDGHGGKQAATYASHALYKYASEYVCADVDGGRGRLDLDSFSLPEKSDASSGSSKASNSYLYAPGFFRQMSKRHNAETFALQVEYMKRLPSAIYKAFLKTDEQARKQFQQGGGTTATMAFLCGWQLLVASVGDSQAFLDTGSEVLSVSANHRLEDNEGERERIVREGGEVAASTVDGKPAGPLRVWPGGLAMSRTIGDVDAGNLCLAEADVVQLTVPKDGARLIIGSDGLWDAVHPKTAAHHTREMTASEASHKLLSMAIKKDHLKDDVTVVVVDIVPPGCDEDGGGKVVPGLRLHSPAKGHKGASAEPKHLTRVWRPLEEVTCVKWVEEELMRRVDEYEAWRKREEEREAVVKRQKEMEKEMEKERKRDAVNMRDDGAPCQGDQGRGQGERVKKRGVVRVEDGCPVPRGGRKSLLDELTNLTLDPESLDDLDNWETVGGDKKQEKAKDRTKKERKERKEKDGANKRQRKKVNNKKPKANGLGACDITRPAAKSSNGVAELTKGSGTLKTVAVADGERKKRRPRNGKKTFSTPAASADLEVSA